MKVFTLFRWSALIAAVLLPVGAQAVPIQAPGADKSPPESSVEASPPPSTQDLPHTLFRRSDPANGNATEDLVGTVGGVTLHVPRGYIDAADGYQRAFGYIKLHALLPCLLPETAANRAEFHKNTIGPVMTLILSQWDQHNLTGQALLDALKDGSKNWRPSPKPNGFENYYADLLRQDVFALKGSDPLFIIQCWRHADVPFPSCGVRERIWNTVLLEYRYDRSFIDNSIGNSIEIDRNVHKLLNSFLMPSATSDNNKTGICK